MDIVREPASILGRLTLEKPTDVRQDGKRESMVALILLGVRGRSRSQKRQSVARRSISSQGTAHHRQLTS